MLQKKPAARKAAAPKVSGPSVTKKWEPTVPVASKDGTVKAPAAPAPSGLTAFQGAGDPLPCNALHGNARFAAEAPCMPAQALILCAQQRPVTADSR